MRGKFERRGGPKQLAVNILEQGDTYETAKYIRETGAYWGLF
jgi:hypothetical protein